MRQLRHIFALVAACCAAIASPALAATPTNKCGVTGSSTAQPIDYDPFNPTGLGTTNVTMTLSRLNESKGSFTRSIFFYLKSQTASANGTEIIAISTSSAVNVAGFGFNLFYDYGTSGPNLLAPPTSTNRYLQIDFTGNNSDSDVAIVNFTVKLPPNVDLAAAPAIGFDVEFRCTVNPNTTDYGTIPDAIKFPIRVLSALQARFAGPALDFGEVGDKTDADVLATPITKKGYVNVASSGPYSVTMTSTNNYKMTYPGGNLALANQSLGYSAKFLGETRSPTATSTISKTCARAGLPLAVGQNLPIEVKLLNGGSTRIPASNYSDNLVVTLTPLDTTTVYATCAGL